jgi:membrane-bound lytic murein transglycosylase A
MMLAMRAGAAPSPVVGRLLIGRVLIRRGVIRPVLVLRFSILLITAFIVASALSSGAFAQSNGPLIIPDTQYEPVEWSDLEGWTSDDHAAAFAAFLGSCRTLQNRRRQSSRDLSLIPAALKDICEDARAAIPLDEAGARKFFEEHFRPIRINRLGDSDGFLTGYYEPIIAGSRVPTGQFTAPLYRRPPNLVPAGRRKLGDAFPSKGVLVGRRVGRRKIVPYYDRGQIEDGALDGWHLEICYLHDEVDVLFAQIQGSARIRLEDGAILRVNYDSHNGWPYTPVGRVLVDQKILNRDQVSMQSIRDWMEANPDQAKEVRRQNRSYVFFRITDLATEDEAVGGQGVPLMPGRSIAIDRALHAYGTPFFIQAELPIANQKTGTKFDRLMIAQDTGSAIVGPARADIYFGAGDEAARIAGRIKNSGTFVMLVPRELDPVAAGSDVPLPPERPSLFSFNLDTMPDPTAPDGTADNVPLPEAKPTLATGGSAAPSAKHQSSARRRR